MNNVLKLKKIVKNLAYKLLLKFENRHHYVNNQPNKYAIPDSRLLATTHHHPI